MKKRIKDPAEYIKPLTINGLHGRVLRIPAKRKVNSKHEILMVYGHHSSLERMFGIAETAALHGNVTMPDLPGFGGMDSFYKINQRPTLDNMADYLATFIKLNYKNKMVNLSGMSFGFLIITRMLQKYPKIANQVNVLVSIVGFANKEDFKFKKKTWILFRYLSSLCSTKFMSGFVKHVVLRGAIIRMSYLMVADKHVKMKDADDEERKRRIDFEIYLWQCNDIRTYMATTVTMMTLDLTKERVNLPLMHISVDADQYFHSRKVKANLKKIYKKVTVYKAKLPNHAPTVISDAKMAYSLIPIEVRKELSRAARQN